MLPAGLAVPRKEARPAGPDPGGCGSSEDLPGLRGALQLLAEELGEGFEALRGACDEQRVAALQRVRVAGPVGPAPAPINGEGVHPGLGLDPQGPERLAVGGGAWGDGEFQDDLVRLADGGGEDGVDLLTLLDYPHHFYRAVGDGLR